MAKDKEEISLKNTKQEILDALNDALKREKELTKTKSNPIEEQKQKEINNAVRETKANVKDEIFSEVLNNKFNKLEIALEQEELRLKELYGIEHELNNLTMIVNTHKDIMINLDNRKKAKEQEINNEISLLEKEYKEKTEQVKNEYTILANNLKRDRERENEEYSYNLKREREIDNNKWLDEKQKRITELAIKETETKKLLDEAKENEKKFIELTKEVERIPEMLAKEYDKSKIETTKELTKEFKYEKDLLIAEYKNTIDRQNDKIETLEKEIDKLSTINSGLQEKMDKAYTELKELATKTVEANGGVKILGSNSQSEKN